MARPGQGFADSCRISELNREVARLETANAHLQAELEADKEKLVATQEELALACLNTSALTTELAEAKAHIEELENASRLTCTERDIENLSLRIDSPGLFSPRACRVLMHGKRLSGPAHRRDVRYVPIVLTWQLVEKTDEELLKYEGFGRKRALVEIREVLRELDLIIGMTIPDSIKAHLPQPTEA